MNYLFFNLGKILLFSSVIVFVMAIISLLIFLIFSHQIITSQDIDEAIIYLIYLALYFYLGFSLTTTYDDKYLDSK
jgi:predicted membrane chloride channel (bestrophin family)